MEKLATFIHAIHYPDKGLQFSCETVENTSWQDQGFHVSREVNLYRFGNGVVIKRTIEEDDFPSEAACAERWTIYEVVSTGRHGRVIDPMRQSFENACREAFWLKYHTT